MHPAKSVIYFTTASGAGYGLLFWLGVLGYRGLIPADRGFGILAFGVAFFLVISGLLSSTGHLGHPERAWRALSQWKSSWLSREGVAAILTFAPTGLYALAWVFLGANHGSWGYLGLFGGLMSLATVYCTSMIYASLKAIPAWRSGWTSPGYIVFSLMSGGVIASLLAAIGGFSAAVNWLLIPVLFFLAVGLVVKLSWWSALDRGTEEISSPETATGLGNFGRVRLIEGPHDQANYLLNEMGFQIARKHASKLRLIALVCAFIVPFVLMILAWLTWPGLSLALLIAALVSGIVGLAAERWLFFAEARHVVMNYYQM